MMPSNFQTANAQLTAVLKALNYDPSVREGLRAVVQSIGQEEAADSDEGAMPPRWKGILEYVENFKESNPYTRQWLNAMSPRAKATLVSFQNFMDDKEYDSPQWIGSAWQQVGEAMEDVLTAGETAAAFHAGWHAHSVQRVATRYRVAQKLKITS